MGFQHAAVEEDPLTPGQALALIVVSQPSCLLSILGSSLIITYILQRQRRFTMSDSSSSSSFSRLMLGLSVGDILLTTWAATAFLCFPRSVGFHYTYGNAASCTLSGYIMMLGVISTNIYNAGLSCQFLAACVGNWSQDQIRRRIEAPTHVLAVTLGLAMPSIGAALQFLNPVHNNRACVIGSEPLDCEKPDSNVDCVRGGTSTLLLWGYVFIAILVVCTVLGITNTLTLSIVATRRLRQGTVAGTRRERRASIDTVNSNNNNNISPSLRQQPTSDQIENRIRMLRKKSILYCLSQLNTTFWSVIVSYVITNLEQTRTLYPIFVLNYLIFPLQGFLNAVIFFEGPFRKQRKMYSDESWYRILFVRVLRGATTTRRQRQQQQQPGQIMEKSNTTTILPGDGQRSAAPSSSSFLMTGRTASFIPNKTSEEIDNDNNNNSQPEATTETGANVKNGTTAASFETKSSLHDDLNEPIEVFEQE